MQDKYRKTDLDDKQLDGIRLAPSHGTAAFEHSGLRGGTVGGSRTGRGSDLCGRGHERVGDTAGDGRHRGCNETQSSATQHSTMRRNSNGRRGGPESVNKQLRRQTKWASDCCRSLAEDSMRVTRHGTRHRRKCQTPESGEGRVWSDSGTRHDVMRCEQRGAVR